MKLSTRSAFALAIFLGAFAYIGGTGLTVSSAWLITMASQHPPILVLSVAIVMVRFFGIFRSLARYGERVISHEAIFRKLTGIRVQLFDAFAKNRGNSSDEIARQSKAIVDDVERAQEFHLRITLPGFSAVVAGLFTLLLATWIDGTLAVWVFSIGLVYSIFIPAYVKEFLDPIQVDIENKENALSADIAQAAHALREAEIFGYGNQYRARMQERIRSINAAEKRSIARISGLQFTVLILMGAAISGIAMHFSQLPAILPITVSMSIFLLLVGFEGFTTWFPSLFLAGKNRRASATVDAFTHIVVTKPAASHKPDGVRVVASNCTPFWNENILNSIDLDLSAGETLVIEGPSGVGKSTFAQALLGMATYGGSLTIGGSEVREIDLLSEYFAASLQSAHIFNTSVRENLKIGNPQATDDEISTLLGKLELDYLLLDEIVGEFGRPLSGGESKRMAIARAILSEAPIVILDEPLEHLDFERSGRLQGVINELLAERTLIVITHSPWFQYSQKLTLTRE